jgi:hypothetical protein
MKGKNQMTKENKAYFDCDLDDGLSGDDIRRRYRESKLGFAAPSADWAECHKVARCIWPLQRVTKPIDYDNEWFKFEPVIVVPATDDVDFFDRDNCPYHDDDCQDDCYDCMYAEQRVEDNEHPCTCTNTGPRWEDNVGGLCDHCKATHKKYFPAFPGDPDWKLNEDWETKQTWGLLPDVIRERRTAKSFKKHVNNIQKIYRPDYRYDDWS